MSHWFLAQVDRWLAGWQGLGSASDWTPHQYQPQPGQQGEAVLRCEHWDWSKLENPYWNWWYQLLWYDQSRYVKSTKLTVQVFHYAQELYEGMKAYRGVDGRLRLFRPDLNMKRMNQTAHRWHKEQININDDEESIIGHVFQTLTQTNSSSASEG